MIISFFFSNIDYFKEKDDKNKNRIVYFVCATIVLPK